MTETKQLLERARRQFPPTSDVMDALVRRRDRKRRNQRIAAGVVGIAVFVAAIWIVTSVGTLDRSDSSVVPGGGVTGPTETGPKETGPAVDADTRWVDAGDPEFDLPPEGAVPSTPKEGTVVDESFGPYKRFVFVYADGRVISYSWPDERIYERRLTPEGVELVRSGEIWPEELLNEFDLPPAHLWDDPELKPFVPSRYVVCFGRESNEPADPSTLLSFFPAPARAILLRAETPHIPDCYGDDQAGAWHLRMVTADEARALFEILGRGDHGRLVRIEDSEGEAIVLSITMMLPHGPSPCTDCW